MTKIFHGGGLDAAVAKYGGKREEWLDLSTGINPNSYKVRTVSSESWLQLPDRLAEQALLDVARNTYLVPSEMAVVAGSGTQTLIEKLPALLNASAVSILSPTYGEHANVWAKAGAKVREVDDIADLTGSDDVVVIVNPNNPDGRIFDPQALIEIADKASCLIVDEAFCDCMPEKSIVPEMPDNAIVLRSFGKFFGLAGLRLGFAICKPQWADQLNSMSGPWAVSGPALEIGTRALGDKQWIEKTRANLVRNSDVQARVLAHFGLNVLGQNPLFIYIQHDRSDVLHEHLAIHQVLARQFPERPEFLRFGLCANNAELELLTAVLEEFNHV